VCHTPVHALRAQLPQSSRPRLYLFLDRTGKPPLREWPNTAPILDALRAGGRKDNYQFAITGCGSQPVSTFQITASPSEAGKRAFCIDQSGALEYAADGQAATC